MVLLKEFDIARQFFIHPTTNTRCRFVLPFVAMLSSDLLTLSFRKKRTSSCHTVRSFIRHCMIC